MQRILFWLNLIKTKSISRKQLVQFIKKYANNNAILDEQLNELNLTDQQIKQLRVNNDNSSEEILKWLENDNNHLVILGEKRYPYLLSQITTPPLMLFIQGNIDTLSLPQLAIIGSRNCTQYGKKWASFFVNELVQHYGMVITSGLARGIDAIAHHCAIKSHGKTVAVLGSGLLNIYPKQHIALAQEIVSHGGTIVTEFYPKQPPIASHFPQRNRIISGLSLGVFIIEASRKSGSLITARNALEQGRELFVLPHTIDHPNGEGCHWLIQNGAYLVSCLTDILDQLQNPLQWSPSITKEIQNKDEQHHNHVIIDQVHTLVFKAVSGDNVTHIDEIIRRTGLLIDDVMIILLNLELAGWVSAISGGYIRIRNT